MNATANDFVKIIIRFDTANIDKMKMKVFFLLNLENNIGTNRPHIAIANVNELTYNPEMAMDVEKYSDICDIMPTMLNGVLISRVDRVKIYRSIFGLLFMLIIFYFEVY